MHIAATQHRFRSTSHHSVIEFDILFALITSYSDFQRQWWQKTSLCLENACQGYDPGHPNPTNEPIIRQRHRV